MPNAPSVLSLTISLLGFVLAGHVDAHVDTVVDGIRAPQRIASLNLCTDQLLLMMVPRARIASVSDWATNPESSYMAAAAKGIPNNRGSAEMVLPQNPDLVLAGQYTDVTLLKVLRNLGYRVETVPIPQNIEQTRAHILRFGELVGEPEKAQRIIADMDRRLAHIDAAVANLPHKNLAAAYAPNGLTVGRGAILTQIIERAGWRNLGSELSIRGYASISLEQLLVAQPDLLVLDITATGNDDSIAHSYLAHPALSTLKKHARSVVISPALSECVGPNTVDAIELLVAQHLLFERK